MNTGCALLISAGMAFIIWASHTAYTSGSTVATIFAAIVGGIMAGIGITLAILK
jgi:hypothetical protein